jgi:hypothetical protein
MVKVLFLLILGFQSWILLAGVKPKPALSEHTFHKLETNLSATSNFVAVKKNVEVFVALSDEYMRY